MSSALPYLQKLRKSDLTELAETSNLKRYTSMRKAELEVALDDHLRANQTTYQDDPSLSDYYRHLGPALRSKEFLSPVKAKAPDKKAIRRKSKSAEEASASSDPDAPVTNAIVSLVQTPSRNSSLLPSIVPMPPSPAAVTDAIDRQTVRMRNQVSRLYSQSGITEMSENLRDLLSSPLAINILALVLEANGLRQEVLPGKSAGFIPAIPYLKTRKTPVYLPDLFRLLDRSFWAPFSLWVTTSLLLPLVCAYFINLPLKTTSLGHRRRTHRPASTQAAAPPSNQFDPLVYNIAKALVAYIVYAHHFTIWGMFQHFTITTVNENVLGGYQGIITGAAIAGILGLYEAILEKR